MKSNEAGQPLNDGKDKSVVLRLLFFVFAILAGMAASTQHFAATMNYQEALGTPLFGRVYVPWDIIKWGLAWADRAELQRLYMTSTAIGIAVIAVLFFIFSFMNFIQKKKALASHRLHGSAKWAKEKDIEASGLLNDQGVFVGAWRNKRGKKQYLIHNGPEHVLCYAPTRSGKGVGLVIPTLLFWKASAVIADLKGELWALTAGWRQKYAKNLCMKFEPAARDSCGWNPFDEVRLDEPENRIGDVQNIATLIVDPDGKGLEDHWQKTAFALLTGCILHLLWKRRQEQGVEASPAALDALLADPQRPLPKLWQEMKIYLHDNGKTDLTVARAAQDMIDRPDNEAGSVISTAKSYLSLYRDPVVAENTSYSSFHIKDLMNSEQPVSLYIVTQPPDKTRLKPIIRLLVSMIVRIQASQMEFVENKAKEYSAFEKFKRKMTMRSTVAMGGGMSAKGVFKHRQLLMLDEFPSLGKLDIMQESLAFIAGYGMKAYLICQDISQLRSEKTGYGRDEAISSNCHVQNCYPPNRMETAEYISKMTGQTTIVKITQTTSGKRFGMLDNQVSHGQSETQRSLLTPDECLRLPGPVKNAAGMIDKAGKMLVFVAGFPCIYGEQALYFQDDIFVARSTVPPPEKSDTIYEHGKDVKLDEVQAPNQEEAVAEQQPQTV